MGLPSNHLTTRLEKFRLREQLLKFFFENICLMMDYPDM